ncbi:hypothetical protein TIFTF001_017320 [Ficus carica]|uniref:Uncharacterized protein n=1 Tax=Ficus carica TaxID=3494 RepID=A0AA88AQI1_FICCA|nr:hypothetical protein TIFTF001_017320 [Ficus carica]
MRVKTTGTWMQGRQLSEEGRKDNGYLGGGEWAMGHQSSREKGRICIGTSIIKTGRYGVMDDNRQERVHNGLGGRWGASGGAGAWGAGAVWGAAGAGAWGWGGRGRSPAAGRSSATEKIWSGMVI